MRNRPLTAPGDWMADSSGLGYAGGALVFAAFILCCLLVIPQRAGTDPETQAKAS